MQDQPATHRVISCDHPAPGTALLRLERRGLDFRPGQYLALGLPGDGRFREYSLHSGTSAPWLEFLIREVGAVSRALGALTPGAAVELEGPFGFFTLDDSELADARPMAWGGDGPAGAAPLLLLATGVGIAPFHSLVTSFPELDYLLLHGVRCAAEQYSRGDFAPGRRIACLSGPEAWAPEDRAGQAAHQATNAVFDGRVTAWLRGKQDDLARRWGADWAERALCLLAGNSDMVHDAWDILADAGVTASRIRTEIFF